MIFRRPRQTGTPKPDVPLKGVLRIKDIQARAEGPNLLHVHVTSRGGEPGTEDEYVQELTYSGSYTVWWSVAEE